MEGSPDGWGKISAVRISAWRNQNEYDSVAAITNIKPAVQNADVLVIMAASCVSPNDPESKGYASYAAAFAQSLEDLGIEAYTTSDLDVTEQALAKTKIAVRLYTSAASVAVCGRNFRRRRRAVAETCRCVSQTGRPDFQELGSAS